MFERAAVTVAVVPWHRHPGACELAVYRRPDQLELLGPVLRHARLRRRPGVDHGRLVRCSSSLRSLCASSLTRSRRRTAGCRWVVPPCSLRRCHREQLDVRRPRDEVALSAVGPFSSFVLAGSFGLASTAARQRSPRRTGSRPRCSRLVEPALGLFNLLPDEPLDGARIQRSVVVLVPVPLRE